MLRPAWQDWDTVQAIDLLVRNWRDEAYRSFPEQEPRTMVTSEGQLFRASFLQPIGVVSEVIHPRKRACHTHSLNGCGALSETQIASISVDARLGYVTLQNNTGVLSPRDLLQELTDEGSLAFGLAASINVLLERELEIQLWSNGYRYHFEYRHLEQIDPGIRAKVLQ